MGIECRGNHEMIWKIQQNGGLLKRMWECREFNTVQLHRMCEAQEAVNTWFYCLAGGAYRDLKTPTAPESVVIDQVGNNEGVVKKQKVDPRLAVLMQLGLTNNAPVQRPREVVEYSTVPATQFSGYLVTALVNQKYLLKGSNAPGEYGYLIQIGTPFAAVLLHDEELLKKCSPSSYEF